MSKKLLLDPILDCLAQIWAPKFFCGFYIRHCSKLPSMKFQGKVMNQTWENDWNASFGPDFDPDLVLNIFLWVLPLLDVTHCCKLSLYAISRKLMNQIWENGKKSSFGTNFCPFGPPISPKIWLRQSPDIMVSHDHVQYQKKLMIQSWENLVTDRRIRVVS